MTAFSLKAENTNFGSIAVMLSTDTLVNMSGDLIVLLKKHPRGYELVNPLADPHQPYFNPFTNPYQEQAFEQAPVSVTPTPPPRFPEARIPSCSTWFNPDTVHPIEKEALPEFFTQSHHPTSAQLYMHFRNFIIRSYRENPTEYLTATACRRALVGDACAIIRVHAFLEKWGLINFEVDPMTRPQSLYQVVLPRTVGEETPAPTLEISWCGYCGNPCMQVWFEHPLITLCAKCFGEGNFPVVISSTEFTQKRAEKLTETEMPRPIEAQTLLAAVEKHGDDWKKVGEVLGRSPVDCLYEFIKLPIKENSNFVLGLKSRVLNEQSPCAFADAANPLLAKVYLAASQQDVPGSEVPELPPLAIDTDHITAKIQEYRDRLQNISDIRQYLSNERDRLTQLQAEFLIQRSELSRKQQMAHPLTHLTLKARKT